MCAVFTLLFLVLPAPAATGEEAVRVFVSVPPQAGLIERLGGKLVEVEVMVPPGRSPATYEPTPRQMARLARARLYVRVGVPFERGFIGGLRKSHPELRIVDQRAGVALLTSDGKPLAGKNTDAADHHVWLDPKRLGRQAANIADGLVAVDPGHAGVYRANLERVQTELRALDARLTLLLAPFRGHELFVFHPAYTYFAASYELEQVAVETGGKEPSARRLAALIDRARRAGARVVFVQPQFSKKSARLVAEAIGGAVVPMDPLARDVIDNLEAMAREVARTLAERGG